MISRDQADEILKMAAHWAEIADGKGWNEAHGEDVDPALTSEAQQALSDYLDALVAPEDGT